MSDDKEYSEFEVSKHTSRSSCWMIIAEKVYDVTPFLEEHPGGEDILMESSGRDSTRGFEDVGHSADARAQLDGLCIGKVRPATEEELAAAEEEARRTGKKPPTSKGETSSVFTTIAKFLVPLLIVGLALFVKKYTSN